MIKILKKADPLFLLKLIFEIRFSDAPLAKEVIIFVGASSIIYFNKSEHELYKIKSKYNVIRVRKGGRALRSPAAVSIDFWDV